MANCNGLGSGWLSSRRLRRYTRSIAVGFWLVQFLGKRNFFSFGRFFTSVGVFGIISKSSASRLMQVATNASTDKKSPRRIWAEKTLNPICLARNFKTSRASALSASEPSLRLPPKVLFAARAFRDTLRAFPACWRACRGNVGLACRRRARR